MMPLSRKFKEEASSSAMTALQTSWMSEIQHSWKRDLLLVQ